jgi:hypothetical protein
VPVGLPAPPSLSSLAELPPFDPQPIARRKTIVPNSDFEVDDVFM